MSEQTGGNAKLYAKLAAVMGQVETVPKSGYNAHHDYNYATEADLVEHIRPLLVEHGLVLIPSCEELEQDGDITAVRMRYRLADTESGEHEDLYVWGYGFDKQDKGPYKAYTGAQKYALMKLFQIPTGDDPERTDARKARRDGQTKRRGGKSAPATDKQMDFVRKLAQSHHVPEEWTTRIEAALGDGMTKQQASDTIERLQQAIAEGEAQESARERETAGVGADEDGDLPF